MWMTYVALFVATFMHVALRATQQLNVMHHKVWWVMPVSFGMATTEVFSIVSVAHEGFGWIVVPVALGGGLGCLAAMYVHARMRGRPA